MRPSGRIVDWLEMQDFIGDDLYFAACVLRQLHCAWSNASRGSDPGFSFGKAVLSEKQRQDGANSLAFVRAKFLAVGLTNAAAASEELARKLLSQQLPSLKKINVRDAISWLEEVEHAARRELKTTRMLFLSLREKTLYENPLSEWEPVVNRWEAVRTDIEEARVVLLALGTQPPFFTPY